MPFKNVPCGGHEYVEDIRTFTINFIINYYENSDIGYTLQIDVHYSEYLHPLHRDLPFLPEKNSIEKLFMSHNIISTRFKTWINSKKVHRVIKFKQCNWLEQYISLNTKCRTIKIYVNFFK